MKMYYAQFALWLCVITVCLLCWLPLQAADAHQQSSAAKSYPGLAATPAARSTQEIIKNGDFELGSNGDWVQYSWAGSDLIWSTAAVTQTTPHSGASLAVLGDMLYFFYPPLAQKYEANRIWQQLAIPADATNVSMRYYYQIRSDDACGHDVARVIVQEPLIPAETIATYDLCQATQATEWVMASFDLTRYAGKTILLTFETLLNLDLGSVFLVDDVSLSFDNPEPPALSFQMYLPIVDKALPPYALNCNATGGSGGLKPGTYNISVAGLISIVIVGKGYNPKQPTLLSFFLHGDAGNYDQNRSASDLVHKLVDEKGWIYVAPLSPGLLPENPLFSSWASAPTQKADLLAAVFDEMFTKYNVCRSVMLGSGVSGGSAFYDDGFFPMKGDRYPSFMILTCGSNVNEFAHQDVDEKIKLFSQLPEMRARTRFQYSYGDQDFLYDNIQSAIQLYGKAGFSVIKDELAGVDHCDFDVYARVRDFWRTASNELNPILFP